MNKFNAPGLQSGKSTPQNRNQQSSLDPMSQFRSPANFISGPSQMGQFNQLGAFNQHLQGQYGYPQSTSFYGNGQFQSTHRSQYDMVPAMYPQKTQYQVPGASYSQQRHIYSESSSQEASSSEPHSSNSQYTPPNRKPRQTGKNARDGSYRDQPHNLEQVSGRGRSQKKPIGYYAIDNDSQDLSNLEIQQMKEITNNFQFMKMKSLLDTKKNYTALNRMNGERFCTELLKLKSQLTGRGIGDSNNTLLGKRSKKDLDIFQERQHVPMRSKSRKRAKLEHPESKTSRGRSRVTRQPRVKLHPTETKYIQQLAHLEEHIDQMPQISGACIQRETIVEHITQYCALFSEYQNFIIDAVQEKIQSSPQLYAPILVSYVQQLLEPSLVVLNSGNDQDFCSILSQLPPNFAILLVLMVVQRKPLLAKEDLMSKVFTENLDKQLDFGYIPKEYFPTLVDILTFQAQRLFDTSTQAPPGFFILCIQQDCATPLYKAYLAHPLMPTNLILALHYLGFPIKQLLTAEHAAIIEAQSKKIDEASIVQMKNSQDNSSDEQIIKSQESQDAQSPHPIHIKQHTEEAKKTEVEQQYHFNFLYPKVINFICTQLLESSRLLFVEFLTKIYIKAEPSVTQLTDLKQAFLLKPQLETLMKQQSKIELGLDCLLKTFKNVMNLSKGRVAFVFNDNLQTQWVTVSAKEASGSNYSGIDRQIGNASKLPGSNDQSNPNISKDKLEAMFTEYTKNQKDVKFSIDDAIKISEKAATIFPLYKHNDYQCLVLAVIIATGNSLIIASMPTGSGKSWVFIMLALHYQNSIIVVPNYDLKQQLLFQIGSDCKQKLIVMTSQEFDPTRHSNDVVLIDECDQHFLKMPYSVVLKKHTTPQDYKVNGPWNLIGRSKIICLSACPPAVTSLILNDLIGTPTELVFKSEYEVANSTSSFQITLENVKNQRYCSNLHVGNGQQLPQFGVNISRRRLLFNAVCVYINENYKKRPIIIFAGSQVQELIMGEYSGKPQYEIHRYSSKIASQLSDKSQYILLMDPKCQDRGIDTRFAIPALVVILCPIESLTQMQQMAGRSNRIRGISEALVISDTYQSLDQLEQDIVKKSADNGLQLCQFLVLLTYNYKWNAIKRKSILDMLYQQQNRKEQIFFLRRDAFVKYIHKYMSDCNETIDKAVDLILAGGVACIEDMKQQMNTSHSQVINVNPHVNFQTPSVQQFQNQNTTPLFLGGVGVAGPSSQSFDQQQQQYYYHMQQQQHLQLQQQQQQMQFQQPYPVNQGSQFFNQIPYQQQNIYQGNDFNQGHLGSSIYVQNAPITTPQQQPGILVTPSGGAQAQTAATALQQLSTLTQSCVNIPADIYNSTQVGASTLQAASVIEPVIEIQ